MLKTNEQNLIVDPNDGRPVAVFVDSFVTGLGVGSENDNVILRLYHQDWKKAGPLVPRDQVHQFLLTAHRAGELGRELLAYAAQVEKEQGQSDH